MNLKKKIVLISTGQPAGNPRLVKEADVLQNAGFEVTVLYCFFTKWASEKDQRLLKDATWKYKLVGGSPTNKKYCYLFTRIRFKLFQVLNRRIGNRFLIAERTQARAYDELLCEAKKIKADWYIGHNLGALSVATKAAAFHKGKAGFDFEDYHREETLPMMKNDTKRIIYLENKNIGSLNYISTASELITEQTKKNHAYFTPSVITLLNCFPLKQQPALFIKAETEKSLQLFWFSQTIGINRGLEVLIKALNYLNDATIHLTLAGRCNEDMLAFIKIQAPNNLKNIHFAGIIEPDELPAFSARFDVGLALELPEPLNRNICLTNKIFTYLLAGNAIILSNTLMQAQFKNTYKIGEAFEYDNMQALAEKIVFYKNEDNLNKQKLHNYQLANNTLNWDNESKKLLAILN